MIQEKRVWELFSELVSIDNPSLREEKMCERIKIFLENTLKSVDISRGIWYNIITKVEGNKNLWKSKKEVADMENIAKALQDLAKAVESNDTVERVKVTITLKKPKASKANTKAE